MKKALLTIAVVLAALSVQAQGIRVGLSGGINSTWLMNKNVFDANDKHLCTLKGKWTSWDFKFLKDEVELAHVSKKWAGIGKELFTSADNYILDISKEVPSEHPIRIMILAAVMCIDMVLKE